MRQLRLRHDIKVRVQLSLSSTQNHWSGSLPLRLTHGRADACLQAGHRHHGLRVHQGLDYRSQAWSLDPLVAFNPGPLKSQSWPDQETLGPCIKDLLTHTLTHYWTRRSRELPEITNGQISIILLNIVHKFQINFLRKIIRVFRNLDSVTPSPVFDTTLWKCFTNPEMFCCFKNHRENCSLLLTTSWR